MAARRGRCADAMRAPPRQTCARAPSPPLTPPPRACCCSPSSLPVSVSSVPGPSPRPPRHHSRLLLIAGCVAAGCGGNPDAKRLYDDLLSNYNKLVRPVLNVSDALTVRIKLKLSQLIDVVSPNTRTRTPPSAAPLTSLKFHKNQTKDVKDNFSKKFN